VIRQMYPAVSVPGEVRIAAQISERDSRAGLRSPPPGVRVSEVAVTATSGAIVLRSSATCAFTRTQPVRVSAAATSRDQGCRKYFSSSSSWRCTGIASSASTRSTSPTLARET